MRKNGKRKAAVAALIIAGAMAIGAAAGGALSSTQAGVSTSPGRHQAGILTSPDRVRAGLSSSPGGGHLALTSRKAGKGQQEYLLAIPGVRGNGGGAGRS